MGTIVVPAPFVHFERVCGDIVPTTLQTYQVVVAAIEFFGWYALGWGYAFANVLHARIGYCWADDFIRWFPC